MDVRPATGGDFEAIRELAHRAWKDTYADVLPEDTIEATVADWYSEESLRGALSKPGTALLVADADGDVAGFCHGVVSGDEGDILRLYVDPERQREGVGRRLYERLRDDLLDFNMHRLRAMVLADNEAGRAFYDALGFEKTGEGTVDLGGETYTEHVFTQEFDDPLEEEGDREARRGVRT